MYMRHDIAQAGEIHFVGLLNCSDCLFCRHHNFEHVVLFVRCQITHFLYMALTNNPAETGESRPLIICHQHHTTDIILKQNIAA